MRNTPPPPPDVFSAISHPARRRILDLLSDADRSVNTLAQNFPISRPAVSQHLRILLDAGLVSEQRHGRQRLYSLAPQKLLPVHDWLAHYDRFWTNRLHKLHSLLSKNPPKEHKK